MNKVGLLKKFLAFSLAIITAITVMANGRDYIKVENQVSAESSEAKANAAQIKKSQQDIDDLEKKQAQLDAKIKAANEGAESEKEKQNNISKQIDVVEKTIQKYDDKINQYQDEINDLTESIYKSEESIKNKEKEIEQGIENFKKRIRVMYVAGSSSYTDILIGADDFYDMLMKIELVKKVADHDNSMIDDLVDLKKQYETEKKGLEEDKKDLEEKLKKQQTEKEKQEAQMDKLDGLYAQSKASEEKLKADAAAYKKNQEKLKKEQAEFEADLQKLFKEQQAIKKKEEEEQRRREEEERRRQEALNQSNNSTSGNAGSGTTTNNSQGSTNNADHGYNDKSMFTWPVPGFYHISYGVGWRWGAYHAGIDIYSENIRGAKICASADGTVIRAVNGCPHDYGKNGSCGCGGGYGNYCIIDHGNGYWTLYGHSEGITVSVGQTVKQGDVLGTVGSTGYSTGPHLHFEVRLNGVAMDPTNYV